TRLDAIRQQVQGEAEEDVVPGVTKTTAPQRYDSYFPDGSIFAVAYGKNAPFKPSETKTASMRFYRPPKPMEINL
ncbi:hypothetical protein KIPB_002554, partial [Kipferlia bialata]